MQMTITTVASASNFLLKVGPSKSDAGIGPVRAFPERSSLSTKFDKEKKIH